MKLESVSHVLIILYVVVKEKECHISLLKSNVKYPYSLCLRLKGLWYVLQCYPQRRAH